MEGFVLNLIDKAIFWALRENSCIHKPYPYSWNIGEDEPSILGTDRNVWWIKARPPQKFHPRQTTFEQWKKPWSFRVFVGDCTTQLCWDYKKPL